MGRLPVLGRCRSIYGRADQRVSEGHSRTDREQPVGVSRRLDGNPEPLGGAPHQYRVSDRLRRRDQQQALRLRREPCHPPPKAVFDPPRQPRRVWQPEPARQLGRRQPPWQLQQRQRVTARLGDEPLPHSLVQRHTQRRAQQRASVTTGQALNSKLRQPFELIPEVARHQHQRDRLRQQPPRHEHQRLRRGAIKPLRVINHTHKRALLGHLRQQAQHRQPDQKPIRRVPRPQPERDAQRVLLGDREPVQPIQHRRAQLLQGGERKLHLRLHTDRTRNPEPRRGRDRRLNQSRLADPSLPANHEHPALAPAHHLEQPFQRLALLAPAVQRLRRPLSAHATRPYRGIAGQSIAPRQRARGLRVA